MWIFLVALFLFLYYMQFMQQNSREGILFNKIPGPKTYPIIGNIWDFIYGPVAVFYQMRKFSSRFSSPFKLWIFSHRILNVYNPEDIEIILTSQKRIEKSQMYVFLSHWLRSGLLTSWGQTWQKRRKILNPAFHINNLRQYCKIFDQQSLQVVEAIRSSDCIDKVDVIPHATQFALYTICETAMGTKLNTSDSTINKYMKAIHDMGEHLVYRLVRPWLYHPWLFSMSPRGREQKETLNVLHGFTANVITDRRKSAAFEKIASMLKSNPDDEDTKSNLKNSVILDVLLLAEMHGHIDEDGVREEVDTFMFAGHDTTTTGIVYSLLALANNKDAQEKAAIEVDEILRQCDGPVTMTELNQMHYLERCIKETLRLYPVAPLIARHLFDDVQLSEYLIPTNTVIHMHIYDMHKCPKIYPAPDLFDPDRFLPENIAKRHPFAYIPFGAGPRHCIGQKFAMLEMKSIISRILQNYVLEPVTKPEEVIFTADIVLRSKNPIYVKFIPRTLQCEQSTTQ